MRERTADHDSPCKINILIKETSLGVSPLRERHDKGLYLRLLTVLVLIILAEFNARASSYIYIYIVDVSY